jgi:hypothetical protein
MVLQRWLRVMLPCTSLQMRSIRVWSGQYDGKK